MRDKVQEGHEGKRKVEALWPVHQINWQRSRYVFDMFYKYKKINRETYDYCIRNKLVDESLIAKWKKPGYERLCATYVINTRNYKFGTTSICRVPKHSLGPDTSVEDPTTGCEGCASGPGGQRNIFGNKYGQYLAAIQIAREEERERREELKRRKAAEAASGGGGEKRKKGKAAADGDAGAEGDAEEDDDDEDSDSDDSDNEEQDGAGEDTGVWARNGAEESLETVDVKNEGGGGGGGGGGFSSSSSSSSSSAAAEPNAKRPRY